MLEVDRVEVHPDIRPVHAGEDHAADVRVARRTETVVLEQERDVPIVIGQPQQVVRDDIERPWRPRLAAEPPEEQAQPVRAEPPRVLDLPIDRSEGLLDLRGAVKEVAPAARDHPDALPVRGQRLRDDLDVQAAFHQVAEVEVEVVPAQPREYLQRRQERLALVRGRRREELGRRTSDGRELERLLVGGVHRLGHAPVLELRVPPNVAEVRDLPAAVDVRAIGHERLLGLLRIRLLREQVVLERVFESCSPESTSRRPAGPAPRSGSACPGSRGA